MQLLDVYPLYDLEPVKASGCFLWDEKGTQYLDLYGGHAVISIGHSHPRYVRRLCEQLQKMGFYSNSVKNSLQESLAHKLGKLSGLDTFRLFLVNSGAEATENALKLAAFHTGRTKIIALKGAFHGRTSAAVAVTDNPRIQSPLNPASHVVHIPVNDREALNREMASGDVCAVIIESIQGVAGAYVTSDEFWREARRLCDAYGTVLVADEIQAGYGRTGYFFGYQSAGVMPDLVTMAKGMGNGFPVGGVLVRPKFDTWHGMLGTTFGGNHLAVTAAHAVLEVLEEEALLENAAKQGTFLRDALKHVKGIKEVRGKGLMVGIESAVPAKTIRKKLLFDHHIFTGSAAQAETLRILPPLCIQQAQLERFVQAFSEVLAQEMARL